MSDGNTLVPAKFDLRLPATYAALVPAMRAVETMDEAQKWECRWEAFRAYYEMARDPEPMNAAIRLQNWAIRRYGELYNEIEPARGANQNIGDGGVPKVGRVAAAEAAGLSERQRKNGSAIANLSQADFEAMNEADPPATVDQLVTAARAQASGAREGSRKATLLLNSTEWIHDYRAEMGERHARATEARAALVEHLTWCLSRQQFAKAARLLDAVRDGGRVQLRALVADMVEAAR
jgi:hypothetical protein